MPGSCGVFYVCWLLGMITSCTMVGSIRILQVVARIAVIVPAIQG
jgi:hypothetical protein